MDMRREAARHVEGAVDRGARGYARDRHLPRVLPGAAFDARLSAPGATRAIVSSLAKALTRERARGAAGHWTYDLARHLGLIEAYRAERRRLREETGGRSGA